MKKTLVSVFILLICSFAVFSQQKGIDSQTTKIKDEARKPTIGNDVSRSWSWGKDKTKIRKKLPNPYKFNARRDILINMIIGILKDNQMIVDEAASRFKDGLIVTQPFIFAKGLVLTKNELNRYSILPLGTNTWTRGRYTLIVDVQSLDGIKNNISVTAKVEGRLRTGLFSEWLTLSSSGTAEDEFLAKLVDNFGGGLPEGQRKP